MKRLLSVVLSLGLLFAFSQAHADATAIGERLIQLMEKAAVVVDANKSNCDAMGDKLDALIGANAQLISDASALSDTDRAAIQNRYRARIAAARAKLQPGIMSCMTNAKVIGAIQKIK